MQQATEASANDAGLVAALRRGDEAAFTELVTNYQPSLVRLAMAYVPNRAAAEDVAQETWLGVLRGLDSFEGRSSLKTWIFRILLNRAKTRGERERRSIPFSAVTTEEASEPASDPSWFYPPGHPLEGWWTSYPRSWDEMPEERVLSRETRDAINAAIDALPPNQQAVINLRDVEGWDSADVRALLGVSEANQRVLLHRARAKVRRALEPYLSEG